MRRAATSSSTGRRFIAGESVEMAAVCRLFFVLEAHWGASLGKRLFEAAAVVTWRNWLGDARRSPDDRLLPWLVFTLLLISFGPFGPMSDQRMGPNPTGPSRRRTRAISSKALTTPTLIAGLFLTARRHNGWTGLHDLAKQHAESMSRSAARLRTRIAPAAAPAIRRSSGARKAVRAFPGVERRS
jgi:hypothetical protein